MLNPSLGVPGTAAAPKSHQLLSPILFLLAGISGAQAAVAMGIPWDNPEEAGGGKQQHQNSFMLLDAGIAGATGGSWGPQ